MVILLQLKMQRLKGVLLNLKGEQLSDIDTTGKTIVKTIYSVKFAKHITGWDWTLFWPVGQHLEVIPLTDVTQLKQGDTLRYKYTTKVKL